VHNLGQTRSSLKSDHLLLTPDTFVRAPLPGMQNANAVVHVGPAIGAAFTAYTAEFELGGELGATAAQRFVYVISGSLKLVVEGKDNLLAPKGFAYLPQGAAHRIASETKSVAFVIEKNYIALPGENPPQPFVGNEDKLSSTALNDDPDLQVRAMIPNIPAHDFAVNTMAYNPGASLSMVEMHVMEHGLIMLEGGGIYRLGDSWYAVTAGDFIWMGPWCPQWFGAIGKVPAKYLIYKDWNRHPLAGPQK
jgi:(S)-ureidoglycine aminohydrolase